MQYEINTDRQYNAIVKFFGPEFYSVLAKNRAFVGGGAISCLFTNRQINDWDIFFQSQDELDTVVGYINSKNTSNVGEKHYSDLAISFDILGEVKRVNDDTIAARNDLLSGNLEIAHDVGYALETNFNKHRVQFITAYIGPIQKILQEFDFHCCMGAFSFATNEFYFDKFFVVDNMNKNIRFNFDGCSSPISALIRADKYKKYGYTISFKEMIKISLGIKNIQLETIGDLKNILKRMNEPTYRKRLKEMFIDSKCRNINFNSDEGRQKYKDVMASKISIDEIILSLEEIERG